jgi:hypothetical protein
MRECNSSWFALVCAVLFALACSACGGTSSPSGSAPDGGGSDVSDAGTVSSCGLPITADIACCPASWRLGVRCGVKAMPERCWGPCLRADNDAGMGYRGQLVCDETGTVGAGLGLFPCSPN